MGLRQLQRELEQAEQKATAKRRRAGAFVNASKQRVKGWFGPWRIVAAGGLVGAVAGWRESGSSSTEAAGEQSAPAPHTESAVGPGGGFSAAIEQATSVVQLISLAAPLLAQYAPLLRANESGAHAGAADLAEDGAASADALARAD